MKDKYQHTKYAKKYRRRHLLILATLTVTTCASIFFLGSSFSKNVLVIDDKSSADIKADHSVHIDSSAGFSFDVPANSYQVLVAKNPGDPLLVTTSYSGEYSKVQLKTNSPVVSEGSSFAKFSVEKKSRKDYDVATKKKSEEDALKEIANFSVTGFTTELIKSEKTKLNNEDFQVFEYSLTPSQPGADRVYTKKWLKLTDNGLYVVTAEDLRELAEASIKFSLPLKTLQVGDQIKLQKLSGSIFSKGTSKKKQEATSDEVSPSVVKIYHFVCGELILDGQALTNDTCDGNVGSGFFVSGDGKVATNGHVVTLTPADFLINIVSASPENTRQLLKFMGVPEDYITSANQEALATSLMSKLYNLPEDRLRINNYRELTVLALGSEPLQFSSVQDVKKLMDFKNSTGLVKAELLARNYSAKDIASLNQQNSSGFSASDVALLQVDAGRTPYIEFANNDQTDVNSKITVIGFPSDAENQLTENDYISPTVTTGTISAKRSANGSAGILFQSDVDASAGNSGGPAINQYGQAVGILTYRYKDETTSNAAKSYIRDINDINDLAKTRDIKLGGDNETSLIWRKGLSNYHESHFSASLRDFAYVQQLYPAHRLVNDYASKASQAIREGRDRPVMNIKVVALFLSTILGIAGIIVVAVAIHRHRLGHHIHKSLKSPQTN